MNDKKAYTILDAQDEWRKYIDSFHWGDGWFEWCEKSVEAELNGIDFNEPEPKIDYNEKLFTACDVMNAMNYAYCYIKRIEKDGKQ